MGLCFPRNLQPSYSLKIPPPARRAASAGTRTASEVDVPRATVASPSSPKETGRISCRSLSKRATRLSTDVILAENNYVTLCHHVQRFAFLLFKQKSAPWPACTVPADANMRPARAVLPRPPRASFINASLILSPSRRQQSGQVSKVYLSSDRGDQRHLSTSTTTTGRTTWPAHARENQLPRTAASCYGSCSSTCGMFMEEGGGRVTG